jgi:PAS domain-containing protein
MLLAVVSLLAAAFFFWNNERRALAIETAARSLDTRLATAIRQTFDLRGAQQAYVSQGQTERFWIAKVAAATVALRESLTFVQGASTAASSRVAVEGAIQALDQFERMDRRAREYASANQKLLASDLIFSDGLEATEEIITALEQARHVEVEDSAAARAGARRAQMRFAATAAVITLAVLILLTPQQSDPIAAEPAAGSRVARTPEGARESSGAAPATAGAQDPVEAFEFRPLARPTPAPAVADAPPAALPADAPDLGSGIETIAEVCRDLARLADTAGLPALLRRAATALDASGVMVWVADPDGRELTAIASHGYQASVLSRIGTIPKDAENLTAAAFRTGLLQTLNADATSPGAIAVPLVNPSGCIGVMSAEVGRDGEQQPSRLALATIVAAQLATLVAPATRAHSKSEAV